MVALREKAETLPKDSMAAWHCSLKWQKSDFFFSYATYIWIFSMTVWIKILPMQPRPLIYVVLNLICISTFQMWPEKLSQSRPVFHPDCKSVILDKHHWYTQAGRKQPPWRTITRIKLLMCWFRLDNYFYTTTPSFLSMFTSTNTEFYVWRYYASAHKLHLFGNMNNHIKQNPNWGIRPAVWT